jgi:hypothetical protein
LSFKNISDIQELIHSKKSNILLLSSIWQVGIDYLLSSSIYASFKKEIHMSVKTGKKIIGLPIEWTDKTIDKLFTNKAK